MDESRKAFERWWEVNCHNGQPPRHGWDFWRDGEGYSIEDDEEFQWRWEAWQASRAVIEIDAEKLKIELENLECAQICLDEAGVPRKEGSEELSMWGRIVRYAAGIKVKE
ncbi:TPA: hypothetical protein MC438_001818 [Enterobacter cloacae]|nr:hypothetical protein [Enterobacter cloacae]